MASGCDAVMRGVLKGFDYIDDPENSSNIHTDYYFDLTETLFGTLELNEEGFLTVRTQGGENEKYIMENDNVNMTIGEEHVLFLIEDDLATEESGPYYLIFHEPIGVMSNEPNEDFSLGEIYYPEICFTQN